MHNLKTQIREVLHNYFPEYSAEHIDYVAENLNSAIRGYTAMKIAQHNCSCETEHSPEFCQGFNCAIRMATGIIQEN